MCTERLHNLQLSFFYAHSYAKIKNAICHNLCLSSFLLHHGKKFIVVKHFKLQFLDERYYINNDYYYYHIKM